MTPGTKWGSREKALLWGNKTSAGRAELSVLSRHHEG